MSDATTEAVERLANNIYAAPMTYCADARDTLRALAARVTELEEKLGRVRTAFRINMLRHVPGITHADIDWLLEDSAND